MWDYSRSMAIVILRSAYDITRVSYPSGIFEGVAAVLPDYPHNSGAATRFHPHQPKEASLLFY